MSRRFPTVSENSLRCLRLARTEPVTVLSPFGVLIRFGESNVSLPAIKDETIAPAQTVLIQGGIIAAIGGTGSGKSRPV